MSAYFVTLHTCGGSMGEAVPPIGAAVVPDLETAEEVEQYFNDHPFARGAHEIWALKHELTEPMSKDDAIAEIKKAYVFEYVEDEE